MREPAPAPQAGEPSYPRITSTSSRPRRPGQRLDRLVAAAVPGLTRTQAHGLLEQALVTVDGRVRPASYQPRPGETLCVEVPAPPPSRRCPNPSRWTCSTRTTSVLVVNKPAGMVVHPAHGHHSGTLVNALLGRAEAPAGGSPRPGIVHRLDKDTSGLLVVAKNDAALLALQAQFAGRTVEKLYVALAHGHLEPPEGVIEGALGRSPTHRQKMALVGRGGRFARSIYRVLERFRGYDLLEVRIETGRTHQIRVHLAAIGGIPWPATRSTVPARASSACRASSCTPGAWRSRIRATAAVSPSRRRCRRPWTPCCEGCARLEEAITQGNAKVEQRFAKVGREPAPNWVRTFHGLHEPDACLTHLRTCTKPLREEPSPLHVMHQPLGLVHHKRVPSSRL